jgi:hypothetical protein
VAESLAVIAVLTPFSDEKPEDAAAIRRALDAALAVGAKAPGPWLQLCKGAADYRQGRWQPALETLDKVRGSRSSSIGGSAEALIAMAFHRTEKPGAATDFWGRAAARIEKGLPAAGVSDLGADPEQWLIYHILLREAQATIPGAQLSQPPARPATRPTTGRIATVR